MSPDPTHSRSETTESEAPSHGQQPVVVHAWWQRLLLRLLASISLGLAIIGAVLPGLPTTVFVLIAAWAAARSSPGLHAWLMQHRIFGPVLINWNNGRRVSRRAKRAAAAVMSLSAAWMLYAMQPRWLAVLLIASMAIVLVWLWRRPEAPACHDPNNSDP
nr:YbaN family protein [Pseudomonas sp.]